MDILERIERGMTSVHDAREVASLIAQCAAMRLALAEIALYSSDENSVRRANEIIERLDRVKQFYNANY